MLVSTNDGRVDDQIFEVRIDRYRLEHAMPYALVAPSAEAAKDAVPLAERIRQITPRRTRPHDPQTPATNIRLSRPVDPH